MKILVSLLLVFMVSCSGGSTSNKDITYKTNSKDKTVSYPTKNTNGEKKNKKYKKKHKKSYYSREDNRFVEIKDRQDVRVAPNSKVEDYLKPYRASLKKKTDEVIAKLKIDLTKKGYSNSLGRFASQIILEKARKYSKLHVDFALLNNGGLRKPLYKGDIKIKDIYELMPFDNYIVVVSVKGNEVKKMCGEIIHHHGLPMAGIAIRAGETDDKYCRVNGKDIDEKKDYLIATINYLYNVGEGVPSLKHGKLVKNMTNHLFRDAIIEYVKEKKVIDKIIPVNYSYPRK